MARRMLELPLAADRDGPGSLTSQVAGQLRDAMADGRLTTGERLPSTRTLAGLLAVSRTVVTAAYAQLFAEGWVEGRHGSGTFVADGAPGRPAGNGQPQPALTPRAVTGDGPAEPDGSMIDLRPGVAWTAGIDQVAWRRAWRSAGAGVTGDLPDPRGRADLRAALTGYLRRSRGVHCSAAQLVVTRGVAGSLGLLAALLRPGDLVGVEEPGYPAARAVFAAHGLRVVPCPVDSAGLRVDALPHGLKLVYATPAHQYPLGGRLSVPRRRALTGWARDTGALIAEDDYDGEFRYDRQPVGALQALAPDHVVHAGTVSKTLAPGVRLGWLVLPARLVGRVAELKDATARHTGVLEQAVLADLLAGGGYDRHVRGRRQAYRRRRDELAQALDRVPGVALSGLAAGLHALVALPPGLSEPEAVRRAAALGLAVEGLDAYAVEPGRRPPALVVGYATPPGHAYAGALERLVRALSP